MTGKADDPLLLALAKAISDGTPVEWDNLPATSDPDVLAIIDELKRVEDVAKLTNTTPTTWGGFELLGEVGRGRFGTVYRALDPTLQREVALKVIGAAAPGTPFDAEKALWEARSLAKIDHPNVVRVFSATRVGDEVGMSMELVRGRTLVAIVEGQAPFSASEAALIGQDVCRALAAVHRAEKLHGDVKAHNVMREDGGRIVLWTSAPAATSAPRRGPTGPTWQGHRPIWRRKSSPARRARRRRISIAWACCSITWSPDATPSRRTPARKSSVTTSGRRGRSRSATCGRTSLPPSFRSCNQRAQRASRRSAAERRRARSGAQRHLARASKANGSQLDAGVGNHLPARDRNRRGRCVPGDATLRRDDQLTAAGHHDAGRVPHRRGALRGTRGTRGQVECRRTHLAGREAVASTAIIGACARVCHQRGQSGRVVPAVPAAGPSPPQSVAGGRVNPLAGCR